MRLSGITLVSVSLLSSQSVDPVAFERQPLKVTVCELSMEPQRYVGQMVEVRAWMIASSDPTLNEAERRETACPAFMDIGLEFPSPVNRK